MEQADLVAYKVATGDFAQVDQPNRNTAFNLQVLLDAYLMTRESKWLGLCEQVLESSSFEVVAGRRGGRFRVDTPWQVGLYLTSVARFVAVLAHDEGRRHDEAIASHLAYSRAVLERASSGRRGRRGGNWSVLISDVMMQAASFTTDDAERESFIEAGKAAFHALDERVRPDGSGPFWNSKTTTMHLKNGGRYMIHAGTEPVGSEPESGGSRKQ